MQTYIEDIGKHAGKDITIKGWLYNKRSSGKIRFMLVRDGTGVVQSVIAKDEVDERTFEAADRITQESSLILTGKVREDERAPGGYEIVAKEIEVLQTAQEYPIT
ncbi:MAG: OB-fold nucleic acid binding domain-containing protein, partial [candidate division WOR-3 bacterium]